MIRPFGRSGWSYNYFEIKMWQYSHYNSEVVIIPAVVTNIGAYFFGIMARVRVNSFMDPFSDITPTKRAALGPYPMLTTTVTINRSLFSIPSS